MSNKNMVDALEGLKEADHLFLCHVVNEIRGKEAPDIHVGSLPFISRSLVKEGLLNYRMNLPPEGAERQHKRVERLLRELEMAWGENSVTFQMKLNPAKLHKSLGARVREGMRELRIPLMTKVDCGITWKEFGKVYEKTEQQVYYVATVRKVGHDLWEITCPKVGNDRTRSWLFERFG